MGKDGLLLFSCPWRLSGLIYSLTVLEKLSLRPDSSLSSIEELVFLELEFLSKASALSSGQAEVPGSPELLPKHGLWRGSGFCCNSSGEATLS